MPLINLYYSIMQKKHLTIVAAAVLLVLLAVIIFRPVPTPLEKDCLSTTGVVSNIYEGGTKDVVFALKGQKQTFYINRGLELGLDLKTLKAELEGKTVTIKYPDYWSLLDPGKSIRHISKLELNSKTIFTEID